DVPSTELARKAAVNVEKAVCASCKYRSHCETIGYQAQLRADADLWIVPNALLLNPMPSNLQRARLLIVDEDLAMLGLSAGSGDVPVENLLDTLKRVELGYEPRLVKAFSQFLQGHAASARGEPLLGFGLEDTGLDATIADRARAFCGKQLRPVDVDAQ